MFSLRDKFRLLTLALPLIFFLACSGSGALAAADQMTELITARQRAITYFKKAQRPDGGFGGGEVTAWVVMALAAAGEDPAGAGWSKGRETPISFLEKEPGSLNKTTDYARLLLAATAAGRDGRNFAGRDLIAYLLASQDENGHFGRGGEEELVNSHAWSILALALAGQPVPQAEAAREWLLKAQNSDGGWGFALGLPSDPDDTAAAVLALRVLGVTPGEEPFKAALDYFRHTQLPDGGFGYEAAVGNAASDALVFLALLALGEDPAGVPWNARGKGLLGHLLSLQSGDGSFRWQQGIVSNPEWMTAQALLALSGPRFLALALPAGPFKDVPGNYWAAEAIRALAQEDVIGGYGDGTFRPQNPVTRAEFSKMLIYALGEQDKATETTGEFHDLKKEHWANKFIKLAVDNGYLRGKGNGFFDPEGKITGAEVMAVLTRVRGLAGPEVEKQGTYWYSVYVELAGREGWLYPNFDPMIPATRAQCAYSIWRSLNL
ncbi:MAG: hypothetical protein PWP65_1305 [Clostridia bacterium]|nr:hypothetical protein [Clostridia bacterium]